MEIYDIIGWLATTIALTAATFKNDKLFIGTNLLAIMTWILAYVLMGKFSVAATLLVIAFRYLISLRFSAENLGVKSGVKLAIFFVILHVIFAAIFWREWTDGIVMVAASILTVGVFVYQGVRLRILAMISALLFVWYSHLIGFLPGVVVDSVNFLILLSTAIRIGQAEVISTEFNEDGEKEIEGFTFRFLPDEEMFPEMGCASLFLGRGIYADIRQGLPSFVERGVIFHELGHLHHPTWSENAVRLYGLVRDPIGTAAVIFYVLFNSRQRNGVFGLVRDTFLRP